MLKNHYGWFLTRSKMKEKNLLKIALICSLAGILVLFIVSQNISIKEKPINKITAEDVDKKIKVSGVVEDIINTEKVAIIKVVQPQNIDVVLFKEGNKSIDIKKDDFIEVIGKVEEYKGKPEIIGQRVRIVR